MKVCASFNYADSIFCPFYSPLELLQLQDLATTMVELWSLMDTPVEEQLVFQNVTKNIAVPADEITELNALTLDFINYVCHHFDTLVVWLQIIYSGCCIFR